MPVHTASSRSRIAARALALPLPARLGGVDLALSGFALLLCALSLLFAASGGFGGEGWRAGLAGHGDDGAVLAAFVVFGLYLAFLGWWPGRGLAGLVKVISFGLAWLFQLAVMGTVDPATYRGALVEAGDPVLAVWLGVFLLALPVLGGAFLLSLSRLDGEPAAA